jgi:hypothetical protein
MIAVVVVVLIVVVVVVVVNCFCAGFLLGPFFDPKIGGDMSLQNVG